MSDYLFSDHTAAVCSDGSTDMRSYRYSHHQLQYKKEYGEYGENQRRQLTVLASVLHQ